MTEETETSRRTVLRRVAVLGGVAVAGCGGSGDDADTPASGEDSPSEGSTSADDSTELGLPESDGTETSKGPTPSPTPDGGTPETIFEPPEDGSETPDRTATPRDETATPDEETVAPPGPPGT